MKKVFAFLSTMLLTIALVGIFSVKTASAAEKFTKDPTLADDEIAVYIMDSIYTTFPQYYDNDAKADGNWVGPARMYPWNETRLRIAQIDAEGNFTGKYYAMYFSGGLKADEIGAGRNILFWDVVDGNVVGARYDDGKRASGGQAKDPSLSHMRTNMSGQDIEFNPTTVLSGDEGINFYNRSLVFNGKGQVIRGIGTDDIYTSAEGEIKQAPEFCYSNGVVTKIAEGVVCDKVMEGQVNEDGEPIIDPETGEQVMVPTDKDNLIYSRFVWEFFEEKPENVNEVGYLAEGWDATLWDYCTEQDGGYMCIAFVGSADGSHNVKGAQVAPYAATLAARKIAALGEEASEEDIQKAKEAAATEAAAARRECVVTMRVPAGGFTFDYGFLDKGKATPDAAFNGTVISGYKYGRKMIALGDDTEIGVAEQKTYNFSVSGLKFVDKVVNGQSVQLLKGQNVVELMQGSELNAVTSINYNGIMRYWGEEDNLLSFTASADALEFYVSESKNGGNAMTMVEPPSMYTSMEAIRNDFLKDVEDYYKTYFGKTSGPDMSTASTFHSYFSWGSFFPTNADNVRPDYPSAEAHSFWNDAEMKAKWHWLMEKIVEVALKYPGGDTYTASVAHLQDACNKGYAGSPQTVNFAFWYFLTEQQHGYFGFNFQDGHASEWIDPRTNIQRWNDYKIDTSLDAINDNYVVTYTVKNSQTGNQSSFTVKYVVVDSYTPIISYNASKLRYVPKKVSEMSSAITVDPINPYDIVVAHDAQYNGTTILGNDISHNIEFETALDFNNPKEGSWPVVATIWNNAHTKKASVKFNILVVDITAPIVLTRKVTVLQGSDFFCLDGVVMAVDGVDGDLFKTTRKWWAEDSATIDTNKINGGKNATYNVKLVVTDAAGNATNCNYQLVVVANNALTSTAFTNEISGLTDQLTQLSYDLADVIEAQEAQAKAIAELKAQIAAVNGKVEEVGNANAESIEALQESVDTVAADLTAMAQKGCGKGAVVALFQVLGAAVLVAFVLRRKH